MTNNARKTMMREACENEGPNLREIWAAADKKAKDWREAGEESLLLQMVDAREGLKSLGWRDGQYAPKDGTRFLSIEAGSAGVFPCYWMTNKHMPEGGGFWSEAHGDLWPAKPTLWKPMPSNATGQAHPQGAPCTDGLDGNGTGHHE